MPITAVNMAKSRVSNCDMMDHMLIDTIDNRVGDAAAFS